MAIASFPPSIACSWKKANSNYDNIKMDKTSQRIYNQMSFGGADLQNYHQDKGAQAIQFRAFSAAGPSIQMPLIRYWKSY